MGVQACDLILQGYQVACHKIPEGGRLERVILEDIRDLEVLLYQGVDPQVDRELCILDISLQTLKPFIVFDLLSREVADHVADFLLDLLEDLCKIHNLAINVLLRQVTELKQLLMLGIHLLIEVFLAFVEVLTK